MFWVSFTHKKGHICSLLSSEAWIFSLCCGFPHWPQTLCSLSQGRIPTNVYSICMVFEEHETKHAQLCITSAPNNSPRRRWVIIPKTPLGFVCCQNHHDKMQFCTTNRANWNFTNHCRRVVHDMLSKNETLNLLSLTGLCCSSCQPNH